MILTIQKENYSKKATHTRIHAPVKSVSMYRTNQRAATAFFTCKLVFLITRIVHEILYPRTFEYAFYCDIAKKYISWSCYYKSKRIYIYNTFKIHIPQSLYLGYHRFLLKKQSWSHNNITTPHTHKRKYVNVHTKWKIAPNSVTTATTALHNSNIARQRLHRTTTHKLYGTA